MTYAIKFKTWHGWRTEKIVGHSYMAPTDKMLLYFPDGSVREIPRWKEREVILGQDWVLAVKKQMESQAGVTIPLAVGG